MGYREGSKPAAALERVERLLSVPTARPSASGLLKALADDLRGATVLVGPDRALEGSAGQPAGVQACIRAASSLCERSGMEAMAHGDWSVRCWELTVGEDQAWLIAARRGVWVEREAMAAARAATMTGVLFTTQRHEAQRNRVREARWRVWQAVLQLLMTGRVAPAQRVAGALEPGVLDASWVRLSIIDERPRAREELAVECEERLLGRAVVVLCPARSGHLIVIEPLADGEAPAHAGTDSVRSVLAAQVAERGTRHLGESRPFPIGQTAAAYAQSAAALAVARGAADRVYSAQGARLLVDCLGPGAGAWAAGLLAGLAAVDHDGSLRHTLAVATTFTAVEAAPILGVHRNTVASRCEAAGRALGLDLSRLRERALADLAMRVVPEAGRASREHPSTSALLAGPKVLLWAQELLERLDRCAPAHPHVRMRDLLRGFVDADGQIGEAAKAVGLSPRTASRWLAAAEQAQGLRLRHGLAGAHDVAVALAVDEGMPLLAR